MYAVSTCACISLEKGKEEAKSTHLVIDADIFQCYYLHEGLISVRGFRCSRENHHSIGIA